MSGGKYKGSKFFIRSVICIKNERDEFNRQYRFKLTLYKLYNLYSMTPTGIEYIDDDNGDIRVYIGISSLFCTTEEWRENKLNEILNDSKQTK